MPSRLANFTSKSNKCFTSCLTSPEVFKLWNALQSSLVLSHTQISQLNLKICNLVSTTHKECWRELACQRKDFEKPSAEGTNNSQQSEPKSINTHLPKTSYCPIRARPVIPIRPTSQTSCQKKQSLSLVLRPVRAVRPVQDRRGPLPDRELHRCTKAKFGRPGYSQLETRDFS